MYKKKINFCVDFEDIIWTLHNMQKHCLSRSRFQIAEFHNIAMNSNDFLACQNGRNVLITLDKDDNA